MRRCSSCAEDSRLASRSGEGSLIGEGSLNGVRSACPVEAYEFKNKLGIAGSPKQESESYNMKEGVSISMDLTASISVQGFMKIAITERETPIEFYMSVHNT
jgi:hypothetical protein